jgi:glycosyltransferase involved in cell wall biosynthesis
MSAENRLFRPTSPFLLTTSADWSKRPPGVDQGVTIILRTRDRPHFLDRAVKSIAAQGLADLTLCVVNDGGDREATEQIVRAEMPTGVEVEFFHNAEPLGQVEALNLGFKQVKREFFAIHDDDDAWSPAFLTEMAGFLRRRENARFIGVACHAKVVDEDVEADRIVFKGSRDHHRYGPVLSLFKLLHFYSHPPPITMLMRRAVLDIVPANNPQMPVMYDCEWMVRVLMHADVGVLDETLAFYHQRSRDRSELGAARNSVFEFGENFRSLLVLIQNELLRDELRRGTLGAGFTSSLVHFLHDLYFPLNDETTKYLARSARRYFRRREQIRKIEATLRRLAVTLRMRRASSRLDMGGKEP